MIRDLKLLVSLLENAKAKYPDKHKGDDHQAGKDLPYGFLGRRTETP